MEKTSWGPTNDVSQDQEDLEPLSLDRESSERIRPTKHLVSLRWTAEPGVLLSEAWSALLMMPEQPVRTSEVQFRVHQVVCLKRLLRA